MQLALADVGLLTMTEVLEEVRKMTGAVSIPVISDIDTGYGNAVNLHRTVREFIRAGVAAVQIEDQVIPKKCGHFDGKLLVPFDEAVLKIKAAVEGLDEAIRRAEAYHEAGADALEKRFVSVAA